MRTLEEIKKKKIEYGYSNEQMARLSGLPLSTVQKVLGGTTKAPRRSTLLALGSVFPQNKPTPPEPNEYTRPVYPLRGVDPTVFAVHEPRPRYGKKEPSFEELAESSFRSEARAQTSKRYPYQGSYTLEDYLALPEDQRVELIDGIFYDMSAPTTPHQIIAGTIYSEIRAFIKSKGGNCVPFIAPVDVQLFCDNKTMVEPDVIVVCDRDQITPARILGAPDFVAEVLSPGTLKKDIFIKQFKYSEAGVREYWMIDPMDRRILKYVFTRPDDEHPDGGFEPSIFGFQDRVPISIFNGECEIDFSEISQMIDFIKK